MKNTQKLILLLFVFLLLSNSSVYAGNAAPYTAEAYKKIESIIINNPPPIEKQILSKQEIMRNRVKYLRNIFNKAGYNYDDTIVKVANDLQNNPDSVPLEHNTVSALIISEVIYMTILERNHIEVDCLSLFSSDVAESIFITYNRFTKNTEAHIKKPKPEPLRLYETPSSTEAHIKKPKPEPLRLYEMPPSHDDTGLEKTIPVSPPRYHETEHFR